MDANDRSKKGQIQLITEYGSQYGQLQVHILEVNNLFLPAVKQLGITHIYVKSHLLNEETKDLMKTKSTLRGFVSADASKELKRKTEEVKLTLSCRERAVCFDETGKSNEKSCKNKLRKALQKQRERFRLRRNSDKVKTVVNVAGEDNGHATVSFERPLYYPSVSLYQLQTQSLHLTICGRNVSTTRSFPIATVNIPLMVAIKQHHPTWYQLCYNPDLVTIKYQQEQEGGTCMGHGPAWDMKETKQPNEDDWLHKRKDYSRHLQQKMRRQTIANNQAVVTKKKSLQNNQPLQSVHDHCLSKKHKNQEQRQLGSFKKPMDDYQGNCINQPDEGIDADKMGSRQDSIEELYFENFDDESPQLDRGRSNEYNVYNHGNFQKPKKQWTSEFLICAPSLDARRTSNGNDLDISSLSLHGSFNRKTFGETIRGF